MRSLPRPRGIPRRGGRRERRVRVRRRTWWGCVCSQVGMRGGVLLHVAALCIGYGAALSLAAPEGMPRGVTTGVTLNIAVWAWIAVGVLAALQSLATRPRIDRAAFAAAAGIMGGWGILLILVGGLRTSIIGSIWLTLASLVVLLARIPERTDGSCR